MNTPNILVVASCCVAIYEDIVVVGSYWDDDNGDESGSAYVFVPSILPSYLARRQTIICHLPTWPSLHQLKEESNGRKSSIQATLVNSVTNSEFDIVARM